MDFDLNMDRLVPTEAQSAEMLHGSRILRKAAQEMGDQVADANTVQGGSASLTILVNALAMEIARLAAESGKPDEALPYYTQAAQAALTFGPKLHLKSAQSATKPAAPPNLKGLH